MRRSIVSFTETPHCVVAVCIAMVALVLAAALPDRMAFIGWAIAALMLATAARTMGVVITVTPTSITRRSPFGEWRIDWAELERVEIGPGCMDMVFHGGRKRIWMARPTSSIKSWFQNYYQDEDEYEDPLVGMVLGMAEDHGAEFGGGWLTPFKTSRA